MSLIPSSYTPHSYIDYVITDPTQTVFSFPKNFLSLSHIQVWGLPVYSGAVWLNFNSSYWTLSGSSGSATLTLGGTFPARVAGDILRIKRVTPDTAAGRLVDFAPGSLSENDLDTAALQNLYITQEVRDEMMQRVGLKYGSEGTWDLGNKKGQLAGTPSENQDIARLQDLNAVSVAAGSLPTPTAAQVGYMLQVSGGGSWSVVSPATVITGLGLGTAAFRAVGTGASDVPDITAADARYLKIASNLADLASASTARTSLGLGTAAVLDVGTTASKVVQFDGSARYPANDGRNIDLSAHALVVATGKLQALATFDIGNSAQTFTTTYAAIDITSATPIAQQLNGTPTIDANAGADTITCHGAATYWIDAEIVVNNESTSNECSFFWQLWAGGAAVYTSPEFFLLRGAAGQRHHVTARRIYAYGLAGATGDIQLKLKKGSVSSGDVRVIEGMVHVVRVAA